MIDRALSQLLLVLCAFAAAVSLHASEIQPEPLNQTGTKAAWEALERNDHRRAVARADSVISEFQREAQERQSELAKTGAPKPPVAPSDNKSRRQSSPMVY